MAITKAVQEYIDKIHPGGTLGLAATDPEFAELFANFSLDEVANDEAAKLPDRERWLAIIAALLGCQGYDELGDVLPGALAYGVTPVEIKEVVYQAVAYLGMGRVLPALRLVNKFLQDQGIELPLPPQGTTTPETRLAAGNQVQIDFFGEGMRERWVDDESGHATITRWLASNCFGDYYTRDGLSGRDREMITFCFIAAQGGCKPQLTSHAAGNMNLGNDRDFLYRVVMQIVPYIGYPRSLNALSCVDKAAAARD